MTSVRWLVAAREEAQAAALWYESRRAGLGGDFVTEIERMVAEIAEAPLVWPASEDDPRARRLLMSRFPYSLVYVLHESGIAVVAVAHLKRQPGYWRGRVPAP